MLLRQSFYLCRFATNLAVACGIKADYLGFPVISVTYKLLQRCNCNYKIVLSRFKRNYYAALFVLD